MILNKYLHDITLIPLPRHSQVNNLTLPHFLSCYGWLPSFPEDVDGLILWLVSWHGCHDKQPTIIQNKYQTTRKNTFSMVPSLVKYASWRKLDTTIRLITSPFAGLRGYPKQHRMWPDQETNVNLGWYAQAPIIKCIRLLLQLFSTSTEKINWVVMRDFPSQGPEAE